MTAILTVTVNPAVDLSSEVEEVRPGDKLRCEPLRRDPGGGGINVARVCRRLGADAAALFTVGGRSGAVLRDLVAAELPRCLPIEVAAETRESFTILERASGQQYRFLFPGGALGRDEERALLKSLEEGPDRPRYLVASGSLAEGLSLNFYARLSAVARQLNAAFVLDSHGPALRAAVEAGGIGILKLNLRELRELTGESLEEEAAQQAAARDLVQGGQCEVVALTLGAEGAFLASGGLCLRAFGLPIEPVSAVGAGDSFLGGLLACLAGDGDLEAAFRQAVAAGTAALLTPGTELCRLDAVQALKAKVILERPDPG